MKFKVGDKVRVVNNASGGFETGEKLEIVKIALFETIQTETIQNLLITDGNICNWHVDYEVELVKNS